MRKICSENRDHYSQRPILGRRFTEVERSRRIFLGCGSILPVRPCLVFVDTLNRMPGAQSQQKSPAQDRASWQRLLSDHKRPFNYQRRQKSKAIPRRDVGRPLPRLAMRLPLRA